MKNSAQLYDRLIQEMYQPKEWEQRKENTRKDLKEEFNRLFNEIYPNYHEKRNQLRTHFEEKYGKEELEKMDLYTEIVNEALVRLLNGELLESHMAG